MGLTSILVKDFQSWLTSSAARPVLDQAEKTFEVAPPVKMAADRLSLSGAATRRAAAAKTAGKAAGKPLSASEKLLASRRVAMNRINGDRREAIVERFLRNKYQAAEGYTVHAEQYLRDRFGRIALEAESNASRRLDFVVFKGDQVVNTVEVTSKTASKTAQTAKELSIRKHGGRYLIVPETGKLVKLPPGQRTDVLRLS